MTGAATVDRRRLGAEAEDAAQLFLIAEGLTPLARNVRYPFGEIDSIMLHDGMLVFVEVRFRRSSNFGGAAGSVDASKRRKIARAAQAWLSARKQFSKSACRFDVVTVAPAAAGLDCAWIRSAFTLDDLW